MLKSWITFVISVYFPYTSLARLLSGSREITHRKKASWASGRLARPRFIREQTYITLHNM
ncbi:hypothetical protein PSPO01_10820 [Paraphaeosphaeria sporulosa]